MLRRVVPWCALVLAAFATLPSTGRAQMVLGIGDDALVLPAGVLRIRALYQVTEFDQRYGENTPGRRDGALEPLAIDFNLDTVGISTFRNLAPLQTGLRSLSSMPEFGLSLGRTVVNSDVTVTATPIVAEFGVSKSFSVGLLVPIVRTRNEIFFQVNPGGTEANTGFNPVAFGDPDAAAQNLDLVTQLNAAATALETAIGGNCATNPDPRCALVNGTRQFAGGIAQIYGTAVGGGSPFVPIVDTDVQLAIRAQIAAFKQAYGPFGALIVEEQPFAAPGPLTTSDAQVILTNPLFGINAEPLETVDRYGIGDIEFGAKYRLFDSFEARGVDRFRPAGFNYRVSAGAMVRFGTGEADLPGNFVDVGTGNGQTDVELRGYTDLLFGRRFWTSFTGRYGWQLADEEVRRITDVPERALAPEYRERSVDRDLGDYFEIEAAPRFAINEYFGLAATYSYRHKAEDEYSGTFQVPGSVTGFGDITLDASTLNLQTEQTEHRIGGGLSYSTLAAFNEGRARIPIEVTFYHWQTTRGSGGNLPKLFTNQLQVRLYARIFGGE